MLWRWFRPFGISQSQSLTGIRNKEQGKSEKKKDVLNTSTQNTKHQKLNTKNQPPNPKNYSTYIVKSGESLWLISKKYVGISAQDIMDFNDIDSNLDVGQKLKIPTE